MLVVTIIIAIVALIISLLAYQRAGGARELKKTVDSLSSTMESLRDIMGEAVDRLEKAVRRKPGEKAPEVRPPKRPGELKEKMPSSEDFQSELDSMFASAQQQGKSFIEIKSGALHRSVGGYTGHVHRLPTCCRVMKKNMKPEDEILQKPPSGAGATLIIRYRLPR